jgi:hypothetical protein
MVENVSDVRLLHDDVSIGMKGLKSFVSDRITQVSFEPLVLKSFGWHLTCEIIGERCRHEGRSVQCRSRE